MINNERQLSLDRIAFLRMRKKHLLAMGVIALILIVGQILVQRHINSELKTSEAMMEEVKSTLAQNQNSGSKLIDVLDEYDEQRKQQLLKLKIKEYIVLALSFLILLLVLFFVFRPLSLYIRNTIRVYQWKLVH